ncbi:MAG TPA: DUF92 domain-containing protein [bacterium]|nr:DUF92 domain-containing protein [bacterium]
MAPVTPLIAFPPVIVGLALSLAVSLTARVLRWLTTDGAVAAVLVGTLVFASGGWPRAGLLVLFFGTSSVLTRWQASRKPHPEHAAGRSVAQVLANGAVATVLSAYGALHPAAWATVAFAGAIAASTADTWATEIGLLSKTPPRLITAGMRRAPATVSPGTSGGVTWLGAIAACAGSAVIADTSSMWLATPLAPVWAGGVFGMALDSLLGAMVEGRAKWMTNDAVNLVATVGGATCAVVLSRW